MITREEVDREYEEELELQEHSHGFSQPKQTAKNTGTPRSQRKTHYSS